MSSLAATQSDNYYIPPEYLDSGQYKKKSLNAFNKSKGHNQYLQRSVGRFELPFDGFCTKCEGHIGKGTRFNAHKSHVDDYFTTKIWQFEMKCRACAKCIFRIRTDPKNRTFDYVEGIRKKHEEFNTLDAGTVGMVDTENEGNTLEHHVAAADGVSGSSVGRNAKTEASSTNGNINPLEKLEKFAHGSRVAMTDRDALDLLRQNSSKIMADDATSNAELRSLYRKERNNRKRSLIKAKSLGLGRDIAIGDLTDADMRNARNFFHEHGENQIARRDEASRKEERLTFRKIQRGSIFSNSKGKRRKKVNQRQAFKLRSSTGKISFPDNEGKERALVYEDEAFEQRPLQQKIKKEDATYTVHANGTYQAGTTHVTSDCPDSSDVTKVTKKKEDSSVRCGELMRGKSTFSTPPSSSSLTALTACYSSSSDEE